jgi:GH35 family endo-1,4-beta-xylanase
MERERGKVNYDLVDAMLQWTDENEMPLRGHNIYWGINQFVMGWVKELNDEELEAVLKERGETVGARYKGRFAEYDLNNEMIHGNYYEDRLGQDITKKMFQWVHNGDPDANLCVNDYDITTGAKLDEYMAHIRLLLGQGIKIAAIGVQGHLHTETFDRGELQRSLDSLSVFNIPVVITEFNMPGQRSKFYRQRDLAMTEEEELQKAEDIVDFYRICFAHPIVKGILMWGFWEGSNWIPVASLYKRDWTPLPALASYQNLIYKEWWTIVSGRTNRKGAFSTPAFYGKYKVTVNGVSKTVMLKKADGKATVDFL